MEGGTSPEAKSNAGENSEAKESLEGGLLKCVSGLRAMLRVPTRQRQGVDGNMEGDGDRFLLSLILLRPEQLVFWVIVVAA